MDNKLKAYRFVWRNPEMGFTDPNTGSTLWHPEIRTVFATSEDEARELFQKNEDDFKKAMRAQSTNEEIIAKATAKTEMTVKEYEIKQGLVI